MPAELPLATVLPDPVPAGPNAVLAAMLLTTPPGVAELAPNEDQWPAVRDCVHALAVRWEILDPRETRYVLTRPEDFSGDLNMLRRRYVELQDAPKVADGERFPDRAMVNELVRFNRSYLKHLQQRQQMEVDRADALRAVMWETDRLYQVWDAVRDARCGFYYVTVRRHALVKLKELIGEEAYKTANLPPSVPLWRFEEMR
jgi:hypothetical protein